MSNAVRYYLDEHVANSVAHGLRQRGVDVQTASGAGLLEASDLVHLSHARSQQRTVFSQDVDFLRLHASGHPHAGIVYAPQQSSVGVIVRGLMLIFELLTREEMENHVEFL